MTLNGLMIDCSRLLEARAYYPRLLRFMAEWEMNTLIFHFCDDHGCAIAFPGFEHLAMPHAFSVDEIGELIDLATSLSIDLIPELETFGHTRYLTDHPDYRHLSASDQARTGGFSAIDPLHPETSELMQGLIGVVADLFPSSFLHIGCDEVDLTAYCANRDLDEETVWAEYVNKMIASVRAIGKTPMIWGDHLAKGDVIARRVRKDVWIIDWRYGDDIEDTVLERLKRFGFSDLLTAPSIAWFMERFHPTASTLENTARMASFAATHQTRGMVNTLWCPYRYLQHAMYYGVAYSACAAREGGRPDMEMTLIGRLPGGQAIGAPAATGKPY